MVRWKMKVLAFNFKDFDPIRRLEMTTIKVAKRGEIIFKEGDKITNLILVQSGQASLCSVKGKKNTEIMAISQAQVAGEQGLAGALTHNFSLLANSEVKYMEIPIEAAKAQVEAAPQFLKMVTKSLLDRLKQALSELRNSSSERDQTPMPEEQVAKSFATVFHTIHHKGQAEDSKNPHVIRMNWLPFKQYGQRVFGESPKRLEQICCILVKMKMASFDMGKPDDNPEGPDEIKTVHVTNLAFVESFFEFYQYYYFKGGSATFLKFDETYFNILVQMLKAFEGAPVDRQGMVTLEYSKLLEFFKTEANLNLTSAHFAQLENRGLFCKKFTRSADNQVLISVDIKEWQNRKDMWRVLWEIDRWNEKGLVDMNEDILKPKKKAGNGPSCPQCSAEVQATAKFCPECDTKLELSGAKVA